MRLIILGSKTCPHCRALLKLMSEVKESNVSYAYLEIDNFLKELTDEDKMKLFKRFQVKPIQLPLVLIKSINNPNWTQIQFGEFTRQLILKYAKDNVNSSLKSFFCFFNKLFYSSSSMIWFFKLIILF